MVLYVTYKKNNIPKRGVLNKVQYEALLKDPTVSELTTHPSQSIMENTFKKSDFSKPVKQVLHG